MTASRRALSLRWRLTLLILFVTGLSAATGVLVARYQTRHVLDVVLTPQLDQALDFYATRQRRFGLTPEQALEQMETDHDPRRRTTPMMGLVRATIARRSKRTGSNDHRSTRWP